MWLNKIKQHKGLFITGTDTDCGKTYASVVLLKQMQALGLSVLAMKPIASGSVKNEQGILVNSDAIKLAHACHQAMDEVMNPYCFEPAISPHLAARQVGVTVNLARIKNNLTQLQEQADLVLVEGAGGWFAPVSDESFIQDLAQTLNLPVVLIVGMKLGCINHALLTHQAILNSKCVWGGWIANRIDPHQLAYAENLATLIEKMGPPMIEVPFVAES